MSSREIASKPGLNGRLGKLMSVLAPTWKKSSALFLGFVFYLCLFHSFPALGQENLDRWRSFSPKEKEEIRRNYQRWQTLSPRDKERLRKEWERWRDLPQDRREQLRQRYDELRRRRPDE